MASALEKSRLVGSISSLMDEWADKRRRLILEVLSQFPLLAGGVTAIIIAAPHHVELIAKGAVSLLSFTLAILGWYLLIALPTEMRARFALRYLLESYRRSATEEGPSTEHLDPVVTAVLQDMATTRPGTGLPLR